MDRTTKNTKKLDKCLTPKDLCYLCDWIDKCGEEIKVDGITDKCKNRLIKLYKKNLFRLIFQKIDIITKRGLKKYLESVYLSVKNEKEHKNNIRKANDELKEILKEFQASMDAKKVYKSEFEVEMEQQEKALTSEVVENYNKKIYESSNNSETTRDVRVEGLVKDCNNKLSLLVEMKKNILELIHGKGTNRSVILKFINSKDKDEDQDNDMDSRGEEIENSDDSPEDNLEETFVRLENVIKDIRNIK